MIQAGTVLDKYELLDRVGQGGMAIVYRGIDRSLKREVAIKVLHKHLADYEEARERFEREAQAVAKLRHENILEIFDYAAKPDEEAYIVTEFIDGQTLKQFITARPLGFPEIAAMVVLQVCRALAHAHAAMVLHRDIKPENIMIRSDGVVKLMDFGISHMVDLERLTVTGQLLGSPAYMAPEHVEGRPIDFRTDVFAVGIVLYQLAVGRLPFEGKNPHEVLKRIAECKFVDPRQANPRIGNRLGRIILRAMAADPADRYQAIGEMVIALDSYLEESGLPADKIPGELARYFKSPASYETALRERLLDHLARRGQLLLERGDQAAALDVLDRALTIDPAHARVLAILDRIGRRRRLKTTAAIGAGALVLGLLSVVAHRQMEPPDESLPAAPDPSAPEGDRPREIATSHELVPAVPADAAAAAVTADATALASTTDARGAGPPAGDAAPVVATRHVRVHVTPEVGAEVRFGDGPWIAAEAGVVERDVPADGAISARNEGCCVEKGARATAAELEIPLAFRPGLVTATCDHKVDVTVDNQPAVLGQPTTVFITALGTRHVKVEFLGDKLEQHDVTVEPNHTVKVACGTP